LNFGRSPDDTFRLSVFGVFFILYLLLRRWGTGMQDWDYVTLQAFVSLLLRLGALQLHHLSWFFTFVQWLRDTNRMTYLIMVPHCLLSRWVIARKNKRGFIVSFFMFASVTVQFELDLGFDDGAGLENFLIRKVHWVFLCKTVANVQHMLKTRWNGQICNLFCNKL